MAPDEPLMAAGLDSLGSVELRNSLEAEFGLALPPTLALDFPSAAAIADYVAARLPSAAEARTGQDVFQLAHQMSSSHAQLVTATLGAPWSARDSHAAMAVTAFVHRCVQSCMPFT